MQASPTILIGMPLFEGWEHVSDALASIRAQTYPHYRLLISVDGGDKRSYEACRPWLDDPRVEIVLHEARLEWAGNMTFLGERLAEDYFCYWQHDDFCDPHYLEKLVAAARRHPEAASIYCDMHFLGENEHIVKVKPTTGFALERVSRQIRSFNPAVIRCLVRADAMRAALPIRLAYLWGIALARAGTLIRVEEVLYFRRIRPQSLTHTMPERPAEVAMQASHDLALGIIEYAHDLIAAGEEAALAALAIEKVIVERDKRKWLYDFAAAGRERTHRFIRDILAEAEASFGFRPDGEALARAAAAGRVRPGAGEMLLMEALGFAMDTPGGSGWA